jgi:hypothetical protein
LPRVATWIVLVVLALVIVVGLLFARGDAAAQDALARHQAKWAGDRAGLASLQRGRPAVESPSLDGNGWDDLVGVITELRPSGRADVAPVEPGEGAARLPRGGPIRTRLAAVRRRPVTPSPLGDPLPVLPGQVFDTGALLDDAARDDLETGHADDALDLLASMVVLAADLERHHAYLPALLARGLDSVAGRRLEAASTRGGSAEAWHRVGSVLDALAPVRPTTGAVLHVHDVTMRGSLFERAEHATVPTNWRDVWGRWPWQWSPRRRAVRALERREALASRLRAIVASPMPGWRGAMAALDPAVAPGAPPRPDAWDDLRVDATIVTTAPVQATLRTLRRVLVALAAYRATHGRLPGTLDALVPGHLRTSPRCALTGAPLRYDAPTGRVWSVGADGDDDGGRSVPMKDGWPDLDGDGDLVVTVAPSPGR